MNATNRERAAYRALADAMLEVAIALEEGKLARGGDRAHPPAPRPQPAPNVVPPEARQPGLLSVPEAADYLSIGHRSLWSMTAPRGPIPSVRFGRAVRYSVEALDEVIAQRSVRPRKR